MSDLKPIKYGLSIEHSKEAMEDDIISGGILKMLAEWQERSIQYQHDMLTLTPEEFAKKYPPPPEPEYCECCGQEICDDYDDY
jgi:hypothetical protein